MRVNRFFIPLSNFHGNEVELELRQVHHIRNVLRLAPGDTIIVLDNAGYQYAVELTVVAPGQVLGKIISKGPALGEPAVNITLFQSLLRRDKFEIVLQKCTEVGVTTFVPVLTEQSIVRDLKSIGKKRQYRWQNIIIEAAEQSHRGAIPKLQPSIKFKDALATLADYDLAIIAAPSDQSKSFKSIINSVNAPKNIALFIGPEGGFSDDELSLALEAGARPLSLGPRILRTETAAPVTVALILYELNQMQSNPE